MITKIRLSREAIGTIFKLTKEIYGNKARVWIFGSRVIADIGGGDIDIYIETEDFTNMLEKRLDFLVRLKNAIGDQKIDLVVKKPGDNSSISLEAKQQGVELTQEVLLYA